MTSLIVTFDVFTYIVLILEMWYIFLHCSPKRLCSFYFIWHILYETPCFPYFLKWQILDLCILAFCLYWQLEELDLMYSSGTFNLHFIHCLSYLNHNLLNFVTPNSVLTALTGSTWKIWLNHPFKSHFILSVGVAPGLSFCFCFFVFFWGQGWSSFSFRCVFLWNLLWTAKCTLVPAIVTTHQL